MAFGREDQPLPFLSILDQPRRRRRGPLPAVLHRPGQQEIDTLLAEHQADPGRRTAQRRLAAELTRLVHGDEGLRTAERATEIFFGAEISQLTDAQLAGIFADVPSKQLPREQLAGDGLPIIDALVESGLCKNKSEARRIITQGGAYVNNRRVEGIETQLTPAHLASESTMVLRSGKKNYALLRFVESMAD